MGGAIRHQIRSNVVALLALFVALSGTAYAVNGPLPGRDSVGSADIIDEDVRSRDIGTGAVHSDDVADQGGTGALTGAEVAAGGLTGSDIDDDSLTGEDVFNESLAGADIDDDSVTGVDVSNGSLVGNEFAEALTGADFNESLRGDKVLNSTVGGSDVENESLTGSHVLGNGIVGDDFGEALGGADFGANSLTGTDIIESSLGQVPAAALAGFTRFDTGPTPFPSEPNCDPSGAEFFGCGDVNLPFSGRVRVLLVARITAMIEPDAENAVGVCRFATSAGTLSPVRIAFHGDSGEASDEEDWMLTAVTPPVTGPQTFSVGCNQDEDTGAIEYRQTRISAVALSAS